MAPWSRLSTEGAARSGSANSAEARRARALREMFRAGFTAIVGAALVAYCMKAPDKHPTLLVIGVIPLAVGLAWFFHGLWRYVKE